MHMAKHRILLSVALALIAGLLVVAPAAAHATTTTFTGLEVTCSEAPAEREWVSDDVLHVRNQIVTTRILTTDDRVTGTNTIVLDFNLNLKNGTGGLYGSFHLQPDEVNGTWQGRFSGHFTNFVTTVHATGHGTGELAGLQEMVRLQGTELPANNSCPAGTPTAATLVTGRILDPHK
jgi:hypothetical protein